MPPESPRQPVEPLWKARDVALYLGVHPQTVYGYVREDSIPFVRVGRSGKSVRFIPAEIREWATKRPAA